MSIHSISDPKPALPAGQTGDSSLISNYKSQIINLKSPISNPQYEPEPYR
jgi:hypothetical protein